MAKKRKQRAFKRVVVISDLHCGHRVGLTPPPYQTVVQDGTPHVMEKCAGIQNECWKWYVREARALKPIDALVVNGDAIDGRGERSGSTELISVNRIEQVDMAEMCVRVWQAPVIIVVRGTAYHTGNIEEYEDLLGERVHAEKVGNHEWLNVNGAVLDFKHHLSASSVPYGRATQVLREWLWSQLWTIAEYQPKSDIIVRSHVHYHVHAGGMLGDRKFLAMTTPALQAMGTRYGATRCSGLVDFGFVHFDINAEGNWEWQAHVAHIKAQVTTAYTL